MQPACATLHTAWAVAMSTAGIHDQPPLFKPLTESISSGCRNLVAEELSA